MEKVIRLVHGNGGRFSHELMEQHIHKYFQNPLLDSLHDGAQFSVPAGMMAMTTDSYVVTPKFFPGGNIGTLAVCGTVNDLSVSGAIPKYLSCGLILEEGLPISELEKALASMAAMAEKSGVFIVTGDTKVVEKGAVDGFYINTAGIGYIPEYAKISMDRVEPNMAVIVSGALGDHAVAVMGTRYGLQLPSSIESDCAPLNHMIHKVLETVGHDVVFMRDATRGGMATTLQEIASQSGVGILLEEGKIPVHDDVKAVCHMLGYDPLYLANEGKVVFVVQEEVAERVVELLRQFPEGRDAAHIGKTLEKNAGKVGLQTLVGGIRLLDMLGEDQVPRIC